VLQQCLVAAGAASALALHALLLLATEGVDARLSWALGVLASIMQAALGFQAFLHLRQADSTRLATLLPAAAGPANKAALAAETVDGRPAPPSAVGESGWLGSFKAYDPNAYGATERGQPTQGESNNPFEEVEAQEVFEARSTNAVSVLTSFGLPFVCVFMVESGDRSIEAIRAASTVTSTFGALGGCALAVVVAVILGFLLERHFSERRLLFAATIGLWSLWLVTTSQDIMQFYGAYLLNRQDAPEQIMAPKAPALAQAREAVGGPVLSALRASHFPQSHSP